ncbi:hypothetical protein EVAR_40253_1 [Eumeta japonica]|uniref:Uncharacterized protein n=1 Tax=Eumeta variegata TaxID=151549 RepID=A0A4C1Y354_EUMVA|nr:hypothetical protein EVAR_40253_1 [Eumeta japonica]
MKKVGKVSALAPRVRRRSVKDVLNGHVYCNDSRRADEVATAQFQELPSVAQQPLNDRLICRCLRRSRTPFPEVFAGTCVCMSLLIPEPLSPFNDVCPFKLGTGFGQACAYAEYVQATRQRHSPQYEELMNVIQRDL